MRMKALFLNPRHPFPVEESYNRGLTFSNGFEIPLDCAYGASILRERGWQVKILDANFFQLDDAQILSEINDFKPDIVFLSPNTSTRWQCPSFTIDWIKPIVAAIKERIQPVPVIAVYGAHATVSWEWVLNEVPETDLVFSGELEAILLAWGKTIQKKIETKQYGEFSTEMPFSEPLKNLDALPFPAYDLLPMQEYKKKINAFSVLASRGCPFDCVYCFRFVFGGRTGKLYRQRSVKNVLDEVELLIKKYDAEKIAFVDWEFCLNKEWVKQFCREIEKRKLAFAWTINTRFPDIDDFELLTAMKEAGLCEVKLGLESGSKTILKNIKKGIDLDRVPAIKKMLDELNIKAFYYGIILSPGETWNTLKESVEFEVKHSIGKGGGKICVPYPNTALHTQAEKQYDREIGWKDLPKVSGTIGTDLLQKQSVESIYRRLYLYYLWCKVKKLIGWI